MWGILDIRHPATTLGDHQFEMENKYHHVQAEIRKGFVAERQFANDILENSTEAGHPAILDCQGSSLIFQSNRRP